MTLLPAVASRLREMNFELNRLETVFQKPQLVSMPLVVQLSTGTRCNLRCAFCTDRGPGTEAHYRDLTLDEFIPLTTGMDCSSTVQLWGWGEPFLNPHYGAIFDYVTEQYPGIEINISTNGTLFDETWQRRLLEYGNFSLNVSINAASKETYRLVAGQDLFGQMERNLRRFRALREEYRGTARTRLTVSFVVVRDNLHEMAAFVDLAARFAADHVQFMDLMHITTHCPDLSAADRAAAVKEHFGAAVERAAVHHIGIGSFLPYAGNDYLAMERYGSGAPVSDDGVCTTLQPCYEPWRTMLVGTDGMATLCCRSGVVTGNVRQTGIAGVWNGETYQAYRGAVNSPAPPEICRLCPVKLGISS